jgi:hypothetical protein
MAIVEIQIRTDRFCELVRRELNSRPLTSAKLEEIDALKGKFLEKVECVSCDLFENSEGSGEVVLTATVAFRYHPDLNSVRAAGSLKPAATAEEIVPFHFKFKIDFNPSLAQPPVLTCELLAFGLVSVRTERFSFAIPGDLNAMSVSIEGNQEVIAIRIGTNAGDSVLESPPINRIGEAEWIQLIPAALIAETVRRVLDHAVDAAVVPPAPPDPNKPWLPKPKNQELRKGKATHALWTFFPQPSALGNGEIIAVDACPLFEVDISIDLSLLFLIDFPDPNTMISTGILTWDADSTWCDILSTLTLGIPIGIGFHIGIEDAVSDSILGKSISPGDGFAEIDRDDDSITYQKVGGPPSPPSRDFDRTHAEVTFEGFFTGGLVRPKAVGPSLTGQMVPATSGLHIDCNLRSVSMVFNPAQVILRNAAAGYSGPPPRVFLEHTLFVPANAWSIRTDVVNMDDPHNTSPQTVLTFVDPPTGRLAAGTSTSVFLFTDFGVRWVDLGMIPEVPDAPPRSAQTLMNKYCDSLSNPWGHGMTHLGWGDDLLLDPDYTHLFEIDPLRMWIIGLRELPVSARIEFLAVGPEGSERFLGIVEGKRSAAIQLVTDANETLAIRSATRFSAPAPMLLQRWMFPFVALPVGSELMTIASASGLLGLRGRDQKTRFFDPREVEEVRADYKHVERIPDPRDGQVTDALAREEMRGNEAWASATSLDKNTIAVTHRGQLLVGLIGTSRRVQ